MPITYLGGMPCKTNGVAAEIEMECNICDKVLIGRRERFKKKALRHYKVVHKMKMPAEQYQEMLQFIEIKQPRIYDSQIHNIAQAGDWGNLDKWCGLNTIVCRV